MKDYLNGPGFVSWLEELLPETVAQKRSGKSSFARAMHRWRTGAQVTVQRADHYLTQFAIPLSWVPEELYEDPRQRGAWSHYSDEFKNQAVSRAEAGEAKTAIALSMGCSPRSISDWQRGGRKVPA